MIEAKNITKTYHLGTVGVQALKEVSFTIGPGEYVAIIGHSGSGKSTLMHVLGLLDRPDSGSYRLCGREVTGLSDDELACLRNRLIGFVFQDFYLLSSLNALHNAELPLIYAGRGADRNKAQEKIAEVGLSQRASHRPTELSGGEQQRVAVARALVNDPLIVFADEPTGNLDTKSAEGIIKLLENLHRQGKTVIMVTHNLEIAERAERVITMRDGVLVSDRRTAAGESPSPKQEAPCPDDVIARTHATGRSAVFSDHLRQALRSLSTHKLRAALSMLGIMIGVGAVIAMLALGQGAKASIAKQLASLGSNLLTVQLRPPRSGGVRLEAGSVARLTIKDAAAVVKLSSVERVSPSVEGRAQTVYGGKNWSTRVQGTGIDYPLMRAAVPKVGRFFIEDEVRRRDKVAVVGATVVRELWGENNPIGSIVKINRINFKVIGVLPTKGATGWRDQDDIVVVPISTAMYRLLGKDFLDSLDVQVKDAALLAGAQEEIKTLLMQEHRISASQEESIDIHNMADIQETLTATTRTMSLLLGAIAAISLLVGGIGIMNIMLVSVTERTREIGLRKAIGARRRDILLQFLIEAVLMTVSGGLLGVVLGAGVAILMAKVAEWAVAITPYSIVLATTFSAAVGLIFGVFPARKAAGLDPIEALRYE
jgi:macrolide transport system ATP-binding/permease protein